MQSDCGSSERVKEMVDALRISLPFSAKKNRGATSVKFPPFPSMSWMRAQSNTFPPPSYRIGASVRSRGGRREVLGFKMIGVKLG